MEMTRCVGDKIIISKFSEYSMNLLNLNALPLFRLILLSIHEGPRWLMVEGMQ